MLIKFFPHGRVTNETGGRSGGGGSVRNYLLGTPDQPREGAKLIYGSDRNTTEIINSIKNSKIYTSGVLSFSEEEQVTDEQKFEIIRSLEETLFPDMRPEQYSGYWVEHQDKGRTELHFVYADIELTTGKALPVFYPKKDTNLTDSWKNGINQKYGLIDPNDPSRKRDFAPTTRNEKDELQKQQIHNWLLKEIEQNKHIQSRDDIVKHLENAGFEITRLPKKDNSISIKNPQGGRNLKFKGTLYDPKFDRNYSLEQAKADYRANEQKRIERQQQEYQIELELRRKRLHTRFGNIDFSPPDNALTRELDEIRIARTDSEIKELDSTLSSREQFVNKLTKSDSASERAIETSEQRVTESESTADFYYRAFKQRVAEYEKSESRIESSKRQIARTQSIIDRQRELERQAEIDRQQQQQRELEWAGNFKKSLQGCFSDSVFEVEQSYNSILPLLKQNYSLHPEQTPPSKGIAIDIGRAESKLFITDDGRLGVAEKFGHINHYEYFYTFELIEKPSGELKFKDSPQSFRLSSSKADYLLTNYAISQLNKSKELESLPFYKPNEHQAQAKAEAERQEQERQQKAEVERQEQERQRQQELKRQAELRKQQLEAEQREQEHQRQQELKRQAELRKQQVEAEQREQERQEKERADELEQLRKKHHNQRFWRLVSSAKNSEKDNDLLIDEFKKNHTPLTATQMEQRRKFVPMQDRTGISFNSLDSKYIKSGKASFTVLNDGTIATNTYHTNYSNKTSISRDYFDISEVCELDEEYDYLTFKKFGDENGFPLDRQEKEFIKKVFKANLEFKQSLNEQKFEPKIEPKIMEIEPKIEEKSQKNDNDFGMGSNSF